MREMGSNQTFSSNTSSNNPGLGLFWVNLGVNSLFAIVGITISTLNGIVIFGFVKEKKIREVPGNIFIQNLAISDCLTGFFAFYMAVLNVCKFNNDFEYLFRMGFVCAFLLASVSFLFYLTLDRYLKVAMHLRYLDIVTDRKQQALCVFTWFVCIVIGCLPLMGWHNPIIKSLSFFETFPRSYTFLVVVLGQVPTICMIFTYTKLFLISRKHRRQIVDQSTVAAADAKKTSEIVRSIFLLIGAYILCWVPIALYGTVGGLIGRDPNQTGVPVFTLLVTLGFINSLLNPLIYAAKIREIRGFFKKVCCCCRESVISLNSSSD